MFADQSLQFEFKGIQTCLEQINTEMNTSDSLVTTTLSEINTNLSTISSHLSTQTQYQFLGVSWDILLPAFISILIFLLGFINRPRESDIECIHKPINRKLRQNVDGNMLGRTWYG